MELKSAVVFCILMEGNGGIIGKAPGYILEKLRRCEGQTDRDYLAGMLDGGNQIKLKMWENRWEKKETE